MNNIRDQLAFFERLSILLNAGISLHESLIIIETQYKKKNKVLFQHVLTSLSHGHSFSESLQKNFTSLSPFVITCIRIGEESGTLLKTTSSVVHELEKTLFLRQKILSALLYPACIALMTLALCIFLIGYMFPKIMPLFKTLHVPLPLTTRILISLTGFFKHYSLLCFCICIVLSCSFFILWKKYYLFRKNIQKFLLSVPLCSKVIKYYELADITRNLTILLQSSLPIDSALAFIENATSYIPYREALHILRNDVLAGESFSKSIQKLPRLFPLDMYHLLVIAERTGTLAESFHSLSQYFELEIERLTKTLASALEPGLMIVMGNIVGFIALSIITPLYAITQHIK